MSSQHDQDESTDRSRQSLSQLKLDELKPLDKIAPDFRAYELTRSDLAERWEIDNRMTGQQQLMAAVYLVRKALQPIRNEFGPLTPKSMFRSQELDQVMKRKPRGWISAGQHALGSAADIEVIGVPTITLAKWAAENLPAYDQIICEYYDPDQGPNSGWVHVSLKRPRHGKNRKQVMTYLRDPSIGVMRYVEGLHESFP